MSLCRDPVIFLLSEAVKLIEESPAKKKSTEYLQTERSLGQKYRKIDRVCCDLLFDCLCLLFSLSQIQSFDFFLTSHQKVVIL